MTRRTIAALALLLALAGGVKMTDDWRIAGAGHSLTWVPAYGVLVLARSPHAVEVGRVSFR